ncbi:hypothetical protein DICVIV_13849 [Dictyocaulus viviparus]|uniref:Uncharacterized protein n=1 Tax=Dictyocaulus viviparus TaxID=29172 RepID=A0A0D8X6Q3_DICVI|nr:hypothetical protein DICVIV_13849 [Dictyocaulus viviparus]
MVAILHRLTLGSVYLQKTDNLLTLSSHFQAKRLNKTALLSLEPPNPLAPKWTLNDIRFKDRVFSNTSVKSPATRAHPRPKPLKNCPSFTQPSTSKVTASLSKEDLSKSSSKKNTEYEVHGKLVKTMKRKIN